MSEKILIPLNGSKSDDAAIFQVTKLINDIKPAEKTEIIIFEIVKPPVKHIPVEGGTFDIYGDEDEIRIRKNSALGYLKRMAEKLKKTGFLVSYEVVVSRPGETRADAIIRAEGELGGNLVAMSVPEKNWFTRRVVRREAEEVIKKGLVPVMMVTAHN